MALGVSDEFRRSNIHNAPFIDDARRDLARSYEVSEPGSGVRVDLVVPNCHDCTLFNIWLIIKA